ncbi:MAG: hypothetical protein QXO67_04705 [Candidatus Bathyarchaeia archaeon]
MNKQIIAAFATLLFILAITGYTYTAWKDSVEIQATVKMGHRKLIIDSHKLLTPTIQGFNETHPIYYYITADHQSLIADCQNVTGNWTIKIGLIIKNNGTLPLHLKDMLITFSIPEISQNFTVTTYYYGPFEPGFNFNPDYWNGITFDQVPPPGNVTPPIPLDPNYHAITWTIIQYVGDPNAQGIDMQITVTPTDDPYP